MKYFLLLLFATTAFAKNELRAANGIVIGSQVASLTAALDVQSNVKGFLPPRMTTTQKNAISSPANGLVVYDTTVGALYVYSGGSWTEVGSGGGGGSPGGSNTDIQFNDSGSFGGASATYNKTNGQISTQNSIFIGGSGAGNIGFSDSESFLGVNTGVFTPVNFSGANTFELTFNGASSHGFAIGSSANSASAFEIDTANKAWFFGDATFGPSSNGVYMNNFFTVDNDDGYYAMQVDNDTSTGTAQHKLVTLTNSLQGITPTTSQRDGIIGLNVTGFGTSGEGTVLMTGKSTCTFDNSTTAGDWVQVSTSTAGDCHDAGSTYPTNGHQVIGRVQTTHSGAGSETVFMQISLTQQSIIPLPEALGGTNQTTYTKGDILWASATNTLSKLPVGSTGQVLTVSASSTLTWQTPSGGGGGGSFFSPNIQVLSASATYTVPTDHTVTWLEVWACGSGGAGGGSADAGDSPTPGDGGNGSSTTFGTSLITAGGGSGGQNSRGNSGAPIGGSGGTSTVTSPAVLMSDHPGSKGFSSGSAATSNGSTMVGACGGASFLYGPACNGNNWSGTGTGETPPANTGAGGQGGATSHFANGDPQGAGGGGGDCVQAMIPSASLSSTYTVTIGGVSTAGTAGGEGFAGGAGSKGKVWVIAHYQ